jgi:hypothetical protein
MADAEKPLKVHGRGTSLSEGTGIGSTEAVDTADTAALTPTKPLQMKKPSFVRRAMGPKGRLAASVAARAAANWKRPCIQANVIGEQMKQTQFSLTDVPEHVFRNQVMSSTYRRGFDWSEKHPMRWNPKFELSQSSVSAPV